MKTKKNSASILLQIIDNSGVDLILDQHQNPCMVLNGSFIAYQIRSKFVQKYLSKIYWEQEGSVLRSDVTIAVQNTLEGMALSSEKAVKTYNRVAEVDDTIYYDLGDNKTVIEITKDGWQTKTECPVLFKRFAHQKVQTLPVTNGSLDKLDNYINIKDKNQDLLLKTYLPVAFFEDIARPILLIHGPQGAGKSTTLNRIRDLIDPSSAPLLAPQNSEVDLIRQANHNYCFYIDNVSSLKGDISDALCRLVTGSAFTKRELYTDDDDIIYEFKRLVGINGIEQAATRADLLDRSLIIELERIDADGRKRDAELRELFEQDKPEILGGLFDLVAGVLELKDSIELEELPRLADYYLYAATAAECLGAGKSEFERVFKLNLNKQNESSLEASPIAQCIVVFMAHRKDWESSPTKLYDNLYELATDLSMTKGFPQGANWLWKAIARAEETLIGYGIEIVKEKKDGLRVIRLINNRFGQQVTADTTSDQIQDLKQYLTEKKAASSFEV